MKQIHIMLKPASSACNLRCKYCFYADLAGKRDTFCYRSMSADTTERILINIRGDLEPEDGGIFAFQGGEPTLAGLPLYQGFVELCEEILQGIHIEYALQTNGTMLNDSWAEFLHNKIFLVGVSLDGLPKYHNGCRVDISGCGTYTRVMDAVQLLREHLVRAAMRCTPKSLPIFIGACFHSGSVIFRQGNIEALSSLTMW